MKRKKKVVSGKKKPDKQAINRLEKKSTKKKLSKKKKKARKIERDEHGRWPKGTSGNTNGRPTGTSATDYAWMALRKVERKTGKNLLEHLFEQALKDNKVLPKAIPFVVPSLRAVAVSGTDDNRMSDEAVQAMDRKREYIKKRMLGKTG